MRTKHVVFAAIPSLACACLLAIAYFALGLNKTAEERGIELNRRAWEASFTERGRAVPPFGPRDGYWGALTKPYVTASPTSEWIVVDVHLSGRVDCDAKGMQHYKPAETPRHRVLILGGSVAWGSYASCIDATYFNVVGRELERAGLPTTVDVLAAPAWKSLNEFNALANCSDANDVNVVVVIDCLNDLTPWVSGQALDGNFTPILANYRQNIDRIANLCKYRGSAMLLVLQPALCEKQNASPLERELMAASSEEAPPQTGEMSYSEALAKSFEHLRHAMGQRQQGGQLTLLDATRLFDSESETTFCDPWHFADVGHELLGKAIAEKLVALLHKDS